MKSPLNSREHSSGAWILLGWGLVCICRILTVQVHFYLPVQVQSLSIYPSLPINLQPESSQALSQGRLESLVGQTEIQTPVPQSCIHSLKSGLTPITGKREIVSALLFQRCLAQMAGLGWSSQLRPLVFWNWRSGLSPWVWLTLKSHFDYSLPSLLCNVAPCPITGVGLVSISTDSRKQRGCQPQEMRAGRGFWRPCVLVWRWRPEGPLE